MSVLMNSKYTIISACLVTLVLSSCGISEEVYNAVVKSRDSLQTIVKSQKLDINRRDEAIEKLKQDIAMLRDEKEMLQKNYLSLKSNSTGEIQKLLAELEETEKDLKLLESNLRQREARLEEVEASLRRRDSTMEALRSRLADALLGFRDRGLEVNVKNGKVYVSLSNKLLFSSGSTKIDQSGKDALKELANVLNTQPDISILVEGHTDDQAIRSGSRFADNWDLSVLRSTEVVRHLVEVGMVDPKRITASGRSEFFPIEEGSTTEIRAKNRRTEIILTPKLEELFEVINK
jgi:chemotaxis protein MotB